MVRRMRDPRRSKRFRRFAFYPIAALLLLLLSQRQLLPRPGIEISQQNNQESEPAIGVKNDQALYKEAGRSFLIRPDQQGIAELNDEGTPLRWEREFGSIITTAAASQSLSAWGLLDGKLFLLDREGLILRIIDPRQEGINSAHPCVYALAMSGQGQSIALLYGISPQYVLVYERKSGFYSLSYSKALQGDLRSTQSAAFSRDGRDLLVKTADGLVYFDRDSGKGALLHPDRFAGKGELLIKAFENDGFALLKAEGSGRYAGLIRHGALEAYFPLPAESFGLTASEDSFIVRAKEKDLVFTRRGDE